MAAEAPFDADIASGTGGRSAEHPRRRVLVVDDDESVARLFGRVLGDYEVRWASSGAEAKKVLSGTTFDAIVSDISMPEMNGIQLLREVRRDNPDVPIVLVTGAPEVKTAVEALEHGALRYLVKPVPPEELRTVVAYAVHVGELAKIKREAMRVLSEKARAASNRAERESAFTRALDSLWMAYQPIVRWSEGRIVAYEALLRTREPAYPGPEALLGTARSLGRLHELGRAVRASVAASIDALHDSLRIFVNLHPLDLGDEDLYLETAPLTRHAERVVLELTEREDLVARAGETRDRMERLRSLGYRLAVDDLGAGYSSLTSFVNLGPEIVKIDMGLVRGVERDVSRQRVIHSILDVCRRMEIDVVSEGVETEEESRALSELGADLMQGYLFSAPSEPFPQIRPRERPEAPSLRGYFKRLARAWH